MHFSLFSLIRCALNGATHCCSNWFWPDLCGKTTKDPLKKNRFLGCHLTCFRGCHLELCSWNEFIFGPVIRLLPQYLSSKYELDWLRYHIDTFKKSKVFKNCIFPRTPQLCRTTASKRMVQFSWNMCQSSFYVAKTCFSTVFMNGL